MKTINNFLLQTFTNNERVKPDVRSYAKRYYALSIIYANAIIGFFVLLWTVLPLFGFPLPSNGQALIVFPCICLSIQSLKSGYTTLSAGLVLFYLNFTSLYNSVIVDIPMVSLWYGMVSVSSCFMLTNSLKLFLLNCIFCLLHNVYITTKIDQAFELNFTEEQSSMILQLRGRSFSVLIFLAGMAYFQKTIETSLWEIAQNNYEKTLSVSKEIVEAAETKDTFVSSLSSEIQNPINAMNSYITLLIQQIKEPAQLQMLKNIKFSSDILLQIVHNLLDIAKLKSDKIELNMKKSGSIDLVKKVVIVYAESLQEKEINTQIFIDKTLPSILFIDPARLLQIILNLFSNAVKYTSPRGDITFTLSWTCREQTRETLTAFLKSSPLPRASNRHNSDHQTDYELASWDSRTFDEFNSFESNIRSRNLNSLKSLDKNSVRSLSPLTTQTNQECFAWKLDRSDQQAINQLIDNFTIFARQQENVAEKGYLLVKITDTGCGIPQENIPRLFQKQFSLQNRQDNHSGLGLWLSWQLCKKMGGDIAVDSQINKGTAFAFYVPVNNLHLLETAAPSSRAPVARDHMSALVVDDYSYNRDLHKLLLEREGVKEVVVACDGKEAVERYISKGNDFYDFIMMDVQMPEMDGFTAAKKIRQHEENMNWKRIDIYFVSGEYYSEEDIISELRSKEHLHDTAGIRCLRKPLGIEMIRNIVKRYSKSPLNLQ